LEGPMADVRVGGVLKATTTPFTVREAMLR
jgi:hypothetical protein